jgi:hypothetical protein
VITVGDLEISLNAPLDEVEIAHPPDGDAAVGDLGVGEDAAGVDEIGLDRAALVAGEDVGRQPDIVRDS